MFLLLYVRHVCVPQKDTNMASPYTEFKYGGPLGTSQMKARLVRL